MITDHAGKAPKEIAVQTAVVYLKKDGRIVHQHEQVTLEGAAIADKAYVEARALEHAARRGHAAADVAVLHLKPGELKFGTHYQVDPHARALIELPAPRR